MRHRWRRPWGFLRKLESRVNLLETITSNSAIGAVFRAFYGREARGMAVCDLASAGLGQRLCLLGNSLLSPFVGHETIHPRPFGVRLAIRVQLEFCCSELTVVCPRLRTRLRIEQRKVPRF